MAVLILALVLDDFSVSYVATNHALSTPFPYNVATAWAALEGSIVLWGLVLAGFTYSVYRRLLRSPDRQQLGAVTVMGLVAIFFFGLMATVANPFGVCVSADQICTATSDFPFAQSVSPVDGPGPNPLLQNHILMSIHPPLLYLGYVGLTVPFAHAISALALSSPGSLWLARSHRSTLVAWTFLSAGIVFGGWWAYEVFSWGGYWAWDPVENASLMPWLVATAFLHSSLVQQRRNMLQAWNFILVIGAFSLTILGTFLTRSGTIQSVHSFTQSAIGPTILAFLAVVLLGSLGLFASRAHLVSDSPRLESFVSREGTFLGNNLLLTVFAFVVIVGTTYPMILEAVTGEQLGVREPFFNRFAVPLSFLLLFLMGLGPVAGWRAISGRVLWSRIHGPLQVALITGVVTLFTISRNGWVALAVVASVFVVGVIVRHLFHLAGRAARGRDTDLRTEVGRLIGNDQRYWAGQLSHIGVAMVALAIALVSNLGDSQVVTLEPGETTEFAGYTLRYDTPFTREEPDKTVEGVRVEVSRNGEHITVAEPGRHIFNSPQPILTPAVVSGLDGDLYLMMRRLDRGVVELQLNTSPMIWMLWLGGLVTAAGGAWATVARVRGAPARSLTDVA
ncbi:MAG: heme lyase CcmF/NrfE family subunit [Acidimicrobiia bacterium]|nr:heme lyase CcmF/NrfE family subunit [Acidimicrobiia bacterium]